MSFQSKTCKKLVCMEMCMMCQLIIGHIVHLKFMTHTHIYLMKKIESHGV